MADFPKNLFSAGHATTSATANSITVTVKSSASSVFDSPGANRCSISCKLASNPNFNPQQTGVKDIGSSYTYTFTGLSPSTSYTITVDILYAAGYSGNYGYDTKTVTTSAATVLRNVSFRHYKNGVYYNTTAITVNDYTTITLSNYAQAISNYTYDKATTTGSQSGTRVTTATITANVTYYLWYNSSIASWAWNSSELNAFNNNGNFSVLTASRWNQFCDKINQVCIAANSSWTTTYTTLSGAKASGPGAPLTALMFMSVKFNIGSRVSTDPIPAIINPGDTVYGSYFITLAKKLNEWITYL